MPYQALATLVIGLWQIFIAVRCFQLAVKLSHVWILLGFAALLMGVRRLSAASLLWHCEHLSLIQMLDQTALPVVVTALMGEFVRRSEHR